MCAWSGCWRWAARPSKRVLEATPVFLRSWGGQVWRSRAHSHSGITCRAAREQPSTCCVREQSALQEPRLSRADFDVNQLAAEWLVAGKVDELVGPRPSVPATFGDAFDEDIDTPPEVARIDIGGDALLKSLDLMEAPPLLVAWHVVQHLRRGDRAGSWRVHRDVDHAETKLLEHAQRIVERLLALAREADD